MDVKFPSSFLSSPANSDCKGMVCLAEILEMTVVIRWVIFWLSSLCLAIPSWRSFQQNVQNFPPFSLALLKQLIWANKTSLQGFSVAIQTPNLNRNIIDEQKHSYEKIYI